MKQKKVFRIFGVVIFIITVMVFGCNKSDEAGQGKPSGGKSSGKSSKKLLDTLSSDNVEAIAQAMESATVADLLALAQSSSSPGGDFSYNLNEAGDGIVIKAYTGSAPTLVIPETIENYPVVQLGNGGLLLTSSAVKALIVPPTVKVISKNAFNDSKLVSVAILPGENGQGLKKIGEEAFKECDELQTVSLPDSLEEIENNAFYSCDKLHTINIPANIKEIGNGKVNKGDTFAFCGELYNLIIPESITSIKWHEDEHADNFYGCGKLPLATRQRLKDLGYTGDF